MTNEEKAKLLVGYEIDTPRNLMRMEARDCCDYLITMAEWKDQQFKEYLEKKLSLAKNIAFDESEHYGVVGIDTKSRIDTVAEIINELFKD